MRFLASRIEAIAQTTTAPSGPLALGSIPAAGAKISSSAERRGKTHLSDFSYRSMFSPPVLRNGSRNTSLIRDSPADRSISNINSTGSHDASSFLGLNNGQTSGKLSHVKRLDLSLLHRSVRRDSTPSSRGTSVTFHMPSGEMQPLQSSTPAKEAQLTPRSILRKRIEISPPSSIASDERDYDSSVNLRTTTSETNSQIYDRTNGNADQEEEVMPYDSHPAAIILTRPDYECEPSLIELAEMAKQNNGICHIENGFTIRRLAFGSVFWPGPFDLNNIDLDKVVHFRQHEVIVYPDDNTKPPVGEQLNRFAEISLDRVWPLDKKTKEFITDPLRLEELGYRAKLERASLKMGAKFKDYRPMTGTWVFTVPHFTKYGLPDEDDDFLDETELKAALSDSKIQDAVQRARVPKLKIAQEGGDGADAAVAPTDGSFVADEFKARINMLSNLHSYHTFFLN
ncbi:unnamed protein product [Gongylonema pulchrum]|uniref:Peptidase S59 domain-containing protein n=1 Tax=Gongylonema pulchrum TaxID=637853 RepID=A0A183CWL2_9BILA|nr:unnamed protein product [Gongylonema pulchrum]